MIEIKKHVNCFQFAKDANKYLQLADAFLSDHPEILYWTERNNSKKGLFYVYKNGVYSIVSMFEIHQKLLEYKPDDPSTAIPSLLSYAKQNETLNYIMSRRFFYREMFDPEGIINFKNGLLDINTYEMRPHTMDIISTSQLPYAYDKDAKCPNFMKVLNDATKGDISYIKIIQEFAGYCLVKTTKYQRGLFIIGAAGSGKSSVLRGIEVMLGRDNVSSTTMDQLSDPGYAGNFFNKSANIDTEISKNIKSYEEAVKKIIVGDMIKVNTKFLPSFDIKPTCKLIFAANDMPIINDTSNGVFRRMLLIYFNNVVKDIDPDIDDRIEREGAGIFNWALEGLKRLTENNGFTQSSRMVEDIEDLKMQNNPVYFFIKENYEITGSKANFVTYNDIYSTYKDFCYEIGAKGIFKKQMLGKEIKKIFHEELEIGQKSINGTTVRGWFGLIRKAKRGDSEEIEWE